MRMLNTIGNAIVHPWLKGNPMLRLLRFLISGRLMFFALFFSLAALNVFSQQLIPNGHRLYPASPTSADNLTLALDPGGEGRYFRYLANGYQVTMSQNAIVVTLGAINYEILIGGGATAIPVEEVDLGRLPAGTYQLTVRYNPNDRAKANDPPLISGATFVVTDARAAKAAPYIRRDYSGHWWDPNDPGWGLFLWHDYRAANDVLFGAWFSYTAEGKPMWYAFQPDGWLQVGITKTTELVQTSRPPGPTSPPATPTSTTAVGTVSMNFLPGAGVDTATITYTFTSGPTLTRSIKRFRP